MNIKLKTDNSKRKDINNNSFINNDRKRIRSVEVDRLTALPSCLQRYLVQFLYLEDVKNYRITCRKVSLAINIKNINKEIMQPLGGWAEIKSLYESQYCGLKDSARVAFGLFRQLMLLKIDQWARDGANAGIYYKSLMNEDETWDVVSEDRMIGQLKRLTNQFKKLCVYNISNLNYFNFGCDNSFIEDCRRFQKLEVYKNKTIVGDYHMVYSSLKCFEIDVTSSRLLGSVEIDVRNHDNIETIILVNLDKTLNRIKLNLSNLPNLKEIKLVYFGLSNLKELSLSEGSKYGKVSIVSNNCPKFNLFSDK